MTAIIIISVYAAVSAIVYFAFRQKCGKNAVFSAPKSMVTFYILSFTWGAPKTFSGALAALVIRLLGHKPEKYGFAWCFELSHIDWGLELGIFFVVPKGADDKIKEHEFGHGIQNIHLGIFTPLVVSLPSSVRFWYRRIRKKTGHLCAAEYDAIWFEDSATKTGINAIKQIENSKKAAE